MYKTCLSYNMFLQKLLLKGWQLSMHLKEVNLNSRQNSPQRQNLPYPISVRVETGS